MVAGLPPGPTVKLSVRLPVSQLTPSDTNGPVRHPGRLVVTVMAPIVTQSAALEITALSIEHAKSSVIRRVVVTAVRTSGAKKTALLRTQSCDAYRLGKRSLETHTCGKHQVLGRVDPGEDAEMLEKRPKDAALGAKRGATANVFAANYGAAISAGSNIRTIDARSQGVLDDVAASDTIMEKVRGGI